MSFPDSTSGCSDERMNRRRGGGAVLSALLHGRKVAGLIPGYHGFACSRCAPKAGNYGGRQGSNTLQLPDGSQFGENSRRCENAKFKPGERKKFVVQMQMQKKKRHIARF